MLALAAFVIALGATAPTRDAPSPPAPGDPALALGTLTRSRQSVCAAVRVDPVPTADEAGLARQRPVGRRTLPTPTFSATSVRDLRFTALVRPRARGFGRLEFRLYTPAGGLYQVLAVPLAPIDRIDRGARALSEVSARLPLSGTAITNSSLYGRWRVDVHVAGLARPCLPSRPFAIQP